MELQNIVEKDIRVIVANSFHNENDIKTLIDNLPFDHQMQSIKIPAFCYIFSKSKECREKAKKMGDCKKSTIRNNELFSFLLVSRFTFLLIY